MKFKDLKPGMFVAVGGKWAREATSLGSADIAVVVSVGGYRNSYLGIVEGDPVKGRRKVAVAMRRGWYRSHTGNDLDYRWEPHLLDGTQIIASWSDYEKMCEENAKAMRKRDFQDAALRAEREERMAGYKERLLNLGFEDDALDKNTPTLAILGPTTILAANDSFIKMSYEALDKLLEAAGA